MLYLALAGLPFSFRTVNLKIGVQNTPEYLAANRWCVVPLLRHRELTILQSNVILDYLARATRHFEGRTEQERWQARRNFALFRGQGIDMFVLGGVGLSTRWA
jgi:glutathione S-transferase